MMERYYSIHGICRFKINIRSNLFERLRPKWDIELKGFKSDASDDLDFVIQMCRFTPDIRRCVILDDDYYLREDYFYCRQDYCKYAKWQLEMSGFEQGRMIVRINSNLLGKMLIPELIINPLIWFKLNQKGYPVIHASAVNKDNKAYIFAGQGASGKSSIALNLVKRGFQLLSEHFVLLNKDAVRSFPTPFHIMDFNVVPIIKNSMSIKHKISFQLRQLFHRLTRKRIVTKILPKDIFPNSLIDKGKLQSIFLLLPRNRLSVKELGKEELINHLVINQKLETFPFIRYMMEYSYLFPQSSIATHWTRYEKNLREILDTRTPFYKVEVPLRYDNETLERVSQLMNKC